MQSLSASSPTEILRGIYRKISTRDLFSKSSLQDEVTGNKPFPFLSLPRELRDEVYSYFLRFDPPEDPFKIPVPVIQYPSLDTSILYVNKQIHDEASNFLYSRNVFPMEMIILGDASHGWETPAGHENIGYKFHTAYKSCWQRFDHIVILPYGFHELSEARFFKIARTAFEVDKDTHDTNSEAPQIPAPRYYHHLRHIKINLLDFRRPRLLQRPLTVSDPVRQTLQTTYQPILHHLKPMLEAAGEALTIDINILSTEHMMHTGRNLSDDLRYWKKYISRRGGPATDHHSDAYYFPLYEDLIRMAWPFTTGPWQCKIQTPMDEVFGEQIQPTLRTCDGNAALNTSITEFKPYFLASGCCWVFKAGRQLVGKLYMREENSTFSDLDGNQYTADEDW
ncbi:hypothetical protein TWF281_008487 [Arthrobotrys megalospora]